MEEEGPDWSGNSKTQKRKMGKVHVELTASCAGKKGNAGMSPGHKN